MRRRGPALLASVVALLAAAPGAQAAQPCAVEADGPRYEQVDVDEFDGSAFRVALCDRRRGAVVTFRRGSIGGVSILGGRVAWGETLRGGRGRIVVADIRRRRVVLRRSVGSAAPFSVEPALLRGGHLAWSVRRTRTGGGRVVLARRGQRPRTIARGPVGGLASEDGVTLRWTHKREIRYREVGRVPVREGCPRRAAFRPAITGPDMLVSVASYTAAETEDDESFVVIRACVRGTGADPVIAMLPTRSIDGPSLDVRAARAGWVVLGETGTTPKNGYGSPSTTVLTVHVDRRRGRTLRSDAGTAFTVTDAGVPAMLAGDRVVSVDATGRQVLLDQGAVADLGASGTAVTWTNGGAPRSATL